MSSYNFQAILYFLSEIFFFLNSVDSDEMPHYAAFHLGLHCLLKYPFRGFPYTKVKIIGVVWGKPVFEFLTKLDSKQSAQLQRLDRILKFCMYKCRKWRHYTLQREILHVQMSKVEALYTAERK